MSRLTMLQKNGITNMVCKNEDCHTPETYCPCTIIDQCECPTLKEVIEKLAHYEALEEQGKLIDQKHGQWEVLDGTYTRFKCSVCGKSQQIRWDYCPHCGAKLDEVKE